MSDKRELGIGNVEVTLVDAKGDPRVVILKPSLHAVRSLSRKYGGVQQVVERVLKVDFDVMVDVIELGMQISVTNPKARAELEQAVYASGLFNADGGLVAVISTYLNILIHGGKPPPPEGALVAPQPNPPSAS